MYYHSDSRDVTYRIYRLLDEQRQQLLQFLLSEKPSSCPLPIHGDINNRVRVDPEEPISETGIYRDLWERRPLGEDDGDMRTRDVIDVDVDYTSRKEWDEAHSRAMRARRRRYGQD